MQYRCSVAQCTVQVYCGQNSIVAVYTTHAVYDTLQFVVYPASTLPGPKNIIASCTAYCSVYFSCSVPCTAICRVPCMCTVLTQSFLQCTAFTLLGLSNLNHIIHCSLQGTLHVHCSDLVIFYSALHLHCSDFACIYCTCSILYTAYILQRNCSVLVVYTAESVRCASSVYCIYTAFRSGPVQGRLCKGKSPNDEGHFLTLLRIPLFIQFSLV